MIELNIQGDRRSYRPGDEVRGTFRWSLSSAPEELVVDLFWYTEGVGVGDMGEGATHTVENAAARGEEEFCLRVPAEPYSFQGELIQLRWTVEAASTEPDESADADIVVSPTGKPIVLAVENVPR